MPKKLIGFLVLVLIGAALGLTHSLAYAGGGTIYLPLINNGKPVVNNSKTIVVDHTTTDINKIPANWLAEARKLTIHYAHTSHGSQIISGLQLFVSGQSVSLS